MDMPRPSRQGEDMRLMHRDRSCTPAAQRIGRAGLSYDPVPALYQGRLRNVWAKIQTSSRIIGHTTTIATNQPDRDEKLPGAPA